MRSQDGGYPAPHAHNTVDYMCNTSRKAADHVSPVCRRPGVPDRAPVPRAAGGDGADGAGDRRRSPRHLGAAAHTLPTGMVSPVCGQSEQCQCKGQDDRVKTIGPDDSHTRTEEHMTTYQLDHQWQHERARLASIEQLFDPCTIACIEATGIQPGWQCL